MVPELELHSYVAAEPPSRLEKPSEFTTGSVMKTSRRSARSCELTCTLTVCGLPGSRSAGRAAMGAVSTGREKPPDAAPPAVKASTRT